MNPFTIYSCAEPAVMGVWAASLTSFSLGLVKVAPPALVEVIIQGIRNRLCLPLNGVPEWPSHYWEATHSQQVVASQSDIGWDSLLRGHISNKWHDAFAAVYSPKKGGIATTVGKAS